MRMRDVSLMGDHGAGDNFIIEVKIEIALHHRELIQAESAYFCRTSDVA